MSGQSWGRLTRASAEIEAPMWRDSLVESLQRSKTFLAYGRGRSYGDVCCNQQGTLIDMTGLKRLLHFDHETGMLVAEAGLTLAELIPVVTQFGWFPPVVPGTSQVTLGGAVANDIHGKNHHTHGSFGHHVLRFELLRSCADGYEAIVCSSEENSDLFHATIGGLGMTGVISVVQIQLIRGGSHVNCEKHSFRGADEYCALQSRLDRKYSHTVAWLHAHDSELSGVILAGELEGQGSVSLPVSSLSMPDVVPSWCLNRLTMKMMNDVYGALQKRSLGQKKVSVSQFFFPLDHISHWNRVYGRRGFYQYQCVIPFERAGVLWSLMREIADFSPGATLGVLKAFGHQASLGMMSFPTAGWTLAMDFPNSGEKLLRFFDDLDQEVLAAGGRVYLAKDARIKPETVAAMYPCVEEWKKLWDPNCSSDFVRRMKWL